MLQAEVWEQLSGDIQPDQELRNRPLTRIFHTQLFFIHGSMLFAIACCLGILLLIVVVALILWLEHNVGGLDPRLVV
jgi:hypothetical protein